MVKPLQLGVERAVEFHSGEKDETEICAYCSARLVAALIVQPAVDGTRHRHGEG